MYGLYLYLARSAQQRLTLPDFYPFSCPGFADAVAGGPSGTPSSSGGAGAGTGGARLGRGGMTFSETIAAVETATEGAQTAQGGEAF